jgi:hypothetical protein
MRVGDRVRVEYEGVVTEMRNGDGTYVLVKRANGKVNLFTEPPESSDISFTVLRPSVEPGDIWVAARYSTVSEGLHYPVYYTGYDFRFPQNMPFCGGDLAKGVMSPDYFFREFPNSYLMARKGDRHEPDSSAG